MRLQRKVVPHKLCRVCPVCDKKGHGADTLKENVRRGIVPKWACAEHNLEDMHARMAPDLNNLSPTQRVQKEAARGNKRRLAALVPSDGTRFRTHIAQAEIVDLTGLGGAAASPVVRRVCEHAPISGACRRDTLQHVTTRLKSQSRPRGGPLALHK